MTDAQSYHDGLIAQGYTPEQALQYTQQHFPDFTGAAPAAPEPAPMPVAEPAPVAYEPAPMAAEPMAAAPMMDMGASMAVAEHKMGDGPDKMTWIASGMVAAAVALIFISLFSNAWMTASREMGDLEISVKEGFSEGEVTMSDSNDSMTITVDIGDCDEEENESKTDCEDKATAALIGQSGLWIGAVAGIAAIALILLNALGTYESGFGKIAAFASGGATIIGAVLWLIMYPAMEDAPDNAGPGMAFYMALVAGVIAVAAGVVNMKASSDE